MPKLLAGALSIAQQLEVWSRDAVRSKLQNLECFEKKNIRAVETTNDVGQFMDHKHWSLKQPKSNIEFSQQRKNVSKRPTSDRPQALKMALETAVEVAPQHQPVLDSKSTSTSIVTSRAWKIRCYNCQEEGYVARVCPQSKHIRRDRANAMKAFASGVTSVAGQNVRGLCNESRNFYLLISKKSFVAVFARYRQRRHSSANKAGKEVQTEVDAIAHRMC